MVDAIETPAAAPAPEVTPAASPVAAATAPDVVSFLNSDGTFKEGWQEALVPEDFRGLRAYGTFTDLKGLLKQVGNQDKVLSRNGRTIVPPSDDATPTEKDMFYEALGRPKEASGYKIEVPQGMEVNKENLADMQARAYKAGLTQAQFKELVSYNNEIVAKNAEAAKTQQEAQRVATENDLKKEWGAAFPEMMAIANQMIAHNVPEAEQPELLAAIGNSKAAAKFLATIGRKFTEAKGVNLDGASTVAMTPAEASAKADELIAEQVNDPKMRSMNPAKYERLNVEIRRLKEMAIVK
jgi:hypothetical protein